MNLVNRAFQLQCVFRENKYMKKLLYTIVLLIAVLIIPAQPAHAQSHWYTKDPIIRHGGGRIGNKNAKNTVSAFKNSAKKGYTVIEMDFGYTSDGVLVCNHDWKTGIQTYKQFRKIRVSNKYRPASAREVIRLMAAYPKVYLVVDAKESDNIVKVYQELKNICYTLNVPKVMDRIIPQFYQQSELSQLKKIYNYKDYIFTLYRLNVKTPSQYAKIAKFCKKNHINVVTIPKGRVTSKVVKYFKKYKIKVYTHTVNYQGQWEKYRAMGVSGIYSDAL